MADPYSGENIVVTLDITVDPVDQVYSIEEVLPAGVVVIDAGDGSLVGDKIRWLEQPPLASQKTYTVRFDSAGTKVFAGTYMFNDEAPVEVVSGETDVVVTSCSVSVEVCDGVDNDCNHLIDEGGVCDECNTNAECGADGWVGSPVCQTDDIYQDYITYTCNSPAATDSTCSDATVSQLKTDCTGSTPLCASATCVECVDNSHCGFNGQCQTNTCSCVVDYLENVAADCCVSTGEIAIYITDWLEGTGPTDQPQVTTAANNWVTGVSACPA